MANSFWNFVSQFTAGTLAKAEDVNTNFSGVEAGFDAVETETDQAIKVTNAAGVTDVVLNAAARANKLLAFDASGDVIASQILGVWKGAHADAAGTDYQVRDVVRDDAGSIQLGSLYICNNTHTSTGSLLTDTANWDILVDATDLTTLGGFTAAQYLRSDTDDTFTGILTLVGSADIDNININGNTISSSSGALNLTPFAGQVILLDGTISVDAGVVTGATSITSTNFVGALGGVTPASVIGTKVEATGDTAADDNAAMGYTATEGLILTGQGSINDVTIKNDADQDVITIPTGTQDVEFAGDIDVQGGRIAFPATAVPSTNENTLDDYQEGIITVTMTPATGTISMNNLGNSLSYTKIGNRVFVSGQVYTASTSSPTGAITVTMPFTSAPLTDKAGEVWTPIHMSGMVSATSGNIAIGSMQENTTDFIITHEDGSSIVAELKNPGETYFGINFSYATAE